MIGRVIVQQGMTDRGEDGSFPSRERKVFGANPFVKGCLQFFGDQDVVVDAFLKAGKDLLPFAENGQGAALSLEDGNEQALQERTLA